MAEPKYDVSDDRSKGDKVKLLPKSDAFGAVDGFPSLYGKNRKETKDYIQYYK